MNVNKVTVNPNTVKLPKYTEKKMMLYKHITIKRNIFPARPTQGMSNGVKSEHQLSAFRGLCDKSLCLGSLKQLYHISQLNSNTQFNLLTSTDELSQNSPETTSLKNHIPKLSNYKNEFGKDI